MLDEFQSWYPLSDKQFSDLWDAGIIVFDTNVLLDQYRYNQTVCDSVFSIMDHFSDQLWIPYQVGLEFSNRRPFVILELNSKYEGALNIISSCDSNLSKFVDGLRKNTRVHLTDIQKIINDDFKKIEEIIKDRQRNNRITINDDKILNKLSDIYRNKIGDAFTSERLQEIKTEGEERYKNQIPPGFKDNDKSNKNRYGDLIIWYQLIEKAKEKEKPIIFVTEDNKGDWFLKINSETIGPRPELIEEMMEKAEVGYYSYTMERFSEYAMKKMELNQNEIDKTIDEIKQIRKEEEKQALEKRNRTSISDGSLIFNLNKYLDDSDPGIADIAVNIRKENENTEFYEREILTSRDIIQKRLDQIKNQLYNDESNDPIRKLHLLNQEEEIRMELVDLERKRLALANRKQKNKEALMTLERRYSDKKYLY